MSELSLCNILLIEDSVSDAVLIEKALMKALGKQSNVCCVGTLETALRVLGEKTFDVALMDLSLPDCAEFDGLLSIQNMAPKLPVVIITAYADEEMALKAVEHGAQDYLFKDKTDGAFIRRSLQYAMQRKHFEATLIMQANFDMLTGLANRTLFESRLDMALARTQRTGSGIGVFFLDLNRFKHINDSLGHAAGDKLLQQMADRLKSCMRSYDTIARFGGDEFALLVEGIEQARDCAIIAQKIIGQISQPFQLGSSVVGMNVSIGIATCFSGDIGNRDHLLQQADEAMYGAKNGEHSHYRFYTAEIQEAARTRLTLENELRIALTENQLTLHYQPKINLDSGHTTGMEALVRWNHPTRGLMLPSEFMAIAEETKLAKELGAWVFSAVCSDMVRWQQSDLPLVRVSINLSASQLDDPSLADSMQALIEKHDIPADLIAVEVPSSALLEHMEARINTMSKMYNLGISVQLDHFGASAISLASLKNLPVDTLKIGPELIKTLGEASAMLPLVHVIMDIAERFQVSVVAAGIETEWQKTFFKEQHCREGQGFAVCRPVPAESIPEWLAQHHG